MNNICVIPKCDRPIKAFSLCSKHYQRLKRNGNTELKIEYNGPRKEYPKEYRIWEGIRERCFQVGSTPYKHYGARGISVCDRWSGPHGFANFIKDMGPRPKNYSIDRIDVNGDYCPENCRWSSPRTQACNKRNNRKIPGVTPQRNSSTWVARYRSNGKNLCKCFKTYDEAVKQRIQWEKENPLD